MLYQKTLQTPTRALGVGLHSGCRVELTFKPAPPDTGIVFRRVDLSKPVDIPVSAQAVSQTQLASTLSHDGVKVGTVEHLMSACAGLGIDNLIVEVTASELPILDGSAAPFVLLFQNAGLQEQNRLRRFVRVKRTVRVQEEQQQTSHWGSKWAELQPYEGFRLEFQIDFAHSKIASETGQHLVFDLGQGQYSRDIARARTFGFSRDVEAMRRGGLGLGGGLDNAIVIDDEKVLNDGGLRYNDELVKHKILDAMGDLYLLGRPLLASYRAFRAGHALNNRLLQKLLAEGSEAFEEVTFSDKKTAPLGFSTLGQCY
jgi:UDP-3-O-[3-hydroxymyristoyl] N-acetylglucosamine deacetylase